jgi:hypothetical protein
LSKSRPTLQARQYHFCASIEDANKEDKETRDRLLNRRMPKLVQFRWKLKILVHSMFPGVKKGNKDFEERFVVSCPS